MSGLNRVICTGNLTRDVELRYTGESVPVCDIRIAIETRVKGEDSACFIDVTAWEKQAESCSKFLRKGSWIAVEGYLKQNEWTTPEGVKRSKICIVAHRVIFLSRGDKAEDRADPSHEG